MSQKDKYGLEFLKISTEEDIGYNCIRKNRMVDENNLLQFLSCLNVSRTEFLLQEVSFFLTQTPDPDWEPYDSMVLEHIDLQIDYPRFIIDEQPNTFPLADIRNLLQEWLEFLQFIWIMNKPFV